MADCAGWSPLGPYFGLLVGVKVVVVVTALFFHGKDGNRRAATGGVHVHVEILPFGGVSLFRLDAGADEEDEVQYSVWVVSRCMDG